MAAKISIIVPVYNVEKYLGHCLDSLVNQTLGDIEIICVDDASQDNSGEILEEYAKRDGRVKILHVKENSGTLYARILGMEQAVGEHIMFVDSDDSLESTTCEDLLEILKEHDVDVVHFGTKIVADENISDELKTWVTRFLLPFDGLIESENLINECFVREQFDFNITNKIWKREVCEQAFSMTEKVRLVASEDRYIFFLLMYYAKSYYGITKKYYQYNLGIGVTGGDVLSLEQFEKRCSGVLASKLVTSFLAKVGAEHRFATETKAFANKILWDCVDCWHNKLAETDEQKGFQILQKYFAPNELVNAIARVYFEQGEDIYGRAKFAGGQKVAVYYRYLGYENMDAKVVDCIFRLKQRGHEVVLYTDADRQELITDLAGYGTNVIYLPDSVDANWGAYENRCNAFYERLMKDEITFLIYASPTSHIYLLDTMLATLGKVAVVDMCDEIYLDEFGRQIQELNAEKEGLSKRIDELAREKDAVESEREELQRNYEEMRVQFDRTHIVSFEYLRFLAVVMIVYDHLGGLRNSNWLIKKGVDFAVTTPLNVIQDFGAFGVSIFFIMSGFLFAWNAHYSNIVGNTVKRILKIYLSSLAAFLIFWFFNAILWNFQDTYWHQFSVKQWLESITLLGYFTGTGDVINGTTWFLIPLFFFYLMSIIYALLVKKFSWKGIWIVESILAIFFYVMHVLNVPNVPPLLIFIYMPLSGVILAEICKAENVSFLQGMFLLLVNYLVMVVCFYRFHYGYYAENLYLVSYIYALLLVIAFFSWEKYFKPNRMVSFIGKISLSVYLLQMTWGSILMQKFTDMHIPFTLAFCAAVFIIVGLSWFHTEFIERKIISRCFRRR